MVKGEEIMPVPGGEITTTELWQQPTEEVVEDSTSEYDTALTEAIEEAKEKINDLPELS
jgi:hypothetical protein